ncbi:MAG: metallophosphoesterase [Bacteroidota bacterium]
MKVQICSDLHLEFTTNREWIKRNPLIPKGDVLIIAGDTSYLERNYFELEFIQQVSDQFSQVYLIPGNHEYYGGFDVATALKPSHYKIMENVFMVNNHTVKIGEVHFIFSTMWSNIQKNILAVMRGMMDFRKIKYQGEKFNINHFNELHKVAFDYIAEAAKTKGKKVIVTHHLPSDECNSKEFKNSTLNGAFCVDKTNFILDHDIDYWIYAHSHRNLKDFKLGHTKLVTNQLGYVGWNEHLTFNREKVFEI